MSSQETFTAQEFDRLTDSFECWELWQYDREGEYLGALPETFPSWRAAWRERKAIVPAPRLRAYWHIVGLKDGRHYEIKDDQPVEIERP